MIYNYKNNLLEKVRDVCNVDARTGISEKFQYRCQQFLGDN